MGRGTVEIELAVVDVEGRELAQGVTTCIAVNGVVKLAHHLPVTTAGVIDRMLAYVLPLDYWFEMRSLRHMRGLRVTVGMNINFGGELRFHHELDGLPDRMDGLSGYLDN